MYVCWELTNLFCLIATTNPGKMCISDFQKPAFDQLLSMLNIFQGNIKKLNI